jgi:tryptophan halogenase
LSAGFVEPLESTGLHLIQSAILRLFSLFADQHFMQADIDAYNAHTDFDMTRIRDFIILHYKATPRDDNEFWNYCRNMEIPKTLSDKMKLYQANGRIFRDSSELFNEIS